MPAGGRQPGVLVSAAPGVGKAFGLAAVEAQPVEVKRVGRLSRLQVRRDQGAAIVGRVALGDDQRVDRRVLETADRIFPELLAAYAPAWLTGLILAGATAAAMSTLDSILHSNMTVLTRDVYQRYIARDRSDRHYLAFGRWLVVALLGVGWVLTVYNFDFLVTLVTLSGVGALQLLPAVLGVCYPGRRLTTSAGVVTGICAGLFTVYLTQVVWPQPLGIHAALWSLVANFVVTIGVSRVTRPPSAATVERVHGEVERFVYGD